MATTQFTNDKRKLKTVVIKFYESYEIYRSANYVRAAVQNTTFEK